MHIREAVRPDLPAIVGLLADDLLGAKREAVLDPLPEAYGRAFDAIQAQRGNVILVCEVEGAVVACLQLTLIPGLARRGTLRAQIEAVRVAPAFRGRKLGRALFEEAIARARAAGCGLVQLTSDKQRGDARRFYRDLGFVASHDGFKLQLPGADSG